MRLNFLSVPLPWRWASMILPKADALARPPWEAAPLQILHAQRVQTNARQTGRGLTQAGADPPPCFGQHTAPALLRQHLLWCSQRAPMHACLFPERLCQHQSRW